MPPSINDLLFTIISFDISDLFLHWFELKIMQKIINDIEIAFFIISDLLLQIYRFFFNLSKAFNYEKIIINLC